MGARRSVQVSVVLASVVGLLTSATGAASAASSWTVTPTPNPGGQVVSDITFAGVSAASATDAWGVGIDQLGAFRLPLAEHWDGTSWHAVKAVAPPNRQAWFNGVLDLGPTNVWAVGETTSPSADNQDVRTLVEHWDGTAWSIVPSPNPATGSNSGDLLNGIAGVGPSNLWAVGSEHDDTLNENVLLFEHWNGASWRAVATPSPPGAEQFGSAISAFASNDVWAVGNAALQQTLAAHWDGRRWTIVPTPSLRDGISPINALTGVTALATNDVWASGYEGNVNNQNFMKPYMLHWDGSSWTLVLTPNLGGEGSRLNATTALSTDDVWAVGQSQGLDGTIITLTERFDGTTWSIVPSPSPGGTNGFRVDSLSGVSSPGGGDLLAVGAREIAGQCCLRTLALVSASG